MTKSINNSSCRPPLRARLHWYKLTVSEFALLTAMVEHCSDGCFIYPSIRRLAAYSKLSIRQVERLIHGYVDRRREKRTPGLKERGILTELAPANGSKRRAATYQLNENALTLDPKMNIYLPRQDRSTNTDVSTAPSLRPFNTALPAAPECIPPLTPCQETSDTMSPGQQDRLPTPRRRSADTVSTDSKANDPSSGKQSNATQGRKIHHGDPALNSLPAWMGLKEALRTQISPEEWDLWARPMYLLRTYGDGDRVQHLLAALPPNSRIIEAANTRLSLLRELLAPTGVSISLTTYPTDWEIGEAKRRHGVDIAPRPWSRADS